MTAFICLTMLSAPFETARSRTPSNIEIRWRALT
jgi:hypothetical protein